MHLLYFSLIAAGMTQILVYGKIFEPIRPTKGWFGKLFSCPMCTGFWVGLFLWTINDYTQLINFDDSLITALLLGCAASGASFLGSMFMGDDGININHTICDEREK